MTDKNVEVLADGHQMTNGGSEGHHENVGLGHRPYVEAGPFLPASAYAIGYGATDSPRPLAERHQHAGGPPALLKLKLVRKELRLKTIQVNPTKSNPL